MSDIPSPRHQLDKKFIKTALINELIESIIIFPVLGVLLYCSYVFSWKEWISWILIGLIVIGVVSSFWAMAFRPFLLYRHTRFDADEDFLQIKSGALFEKHELIPMTKIQSVETNQGPVMRKFALYSLSVKTMSSSHKITGLPEALAQEMKGQIAQYAKIKEVDT